MLQLVGLVVTFITLLMNDMLRSALYLRACVRAWMRANAYASLAYLEKRTISLSRVVGVGIAFVGMRIRSYIYMRVTYIGRRI